MPLLSRSAALIAFAISAQLASAASIQVTLSGNINASNESAFPVGQALTISFTYDSLSPMSLFSNGQAFYSNPFSSLSVTSGGYSSSYSGSFGQITTYDGIGANQDGIGFLFAGGP